MSLETELRQALRQPEGDLDAGAVNAALAQVRTRGRGALVRRRAMAAVAVAAALALVAGFAMQQREHGSATDDPARIAEQPTAPVARTTPLEGTWRTPVLATQDLRSALREGGLQRHQAAIETAWDGLIGGRIVLAIHDGHVVAVVRTGGSGLTVDDQQLEVTGNLVTLRPFPPSTWATTYRWTVRGDRLTLTLLRSSEGATAGVPGEAWQRAIYTSTPFIRQ